MARAATAFDHISELFAAFGPVAVKRMFGGAGIYANGTIFAITVDGVIYLKADGVTVPAFEREGLLPFSYGTGKKRAVMSYWRVPERLYDDPEELAQWAARGPRRGTARRRGQGARQTAGENVNAKPKFRRLCFRRHWPLDHSRQSRGCGRHASLRRGRRRRGQSAMPRCRPRARSQPRLKS